MTATINIQRLWDQRYRDESVPFPVDGVPASGGISSFYDVTGDAYGALGNGVANDTAAIQSAIDAAFAVGGGIVWIPVGVYMITQLVVKDGVSIWGAGEGGVFNNTHSGHTPGTILRAVAGSSTHMITQASGLGVISSPSFRGFTLDGNNGSNFSSPAQTANSFDGFNFSAQVVRFKIESVTIQNVPRDGINFAAAVSMGGAYLGAVTVVNPYRHGVNHQGSDVHYNQVEVINPGQNSFFIAGTQALWTNCKSNTSGQLQLGAGTENGFHITGSSHILAACSSENDYQTAGNGFYVSGARNKIHGTASGSGNALLYLDGATENDVDLIGNNQQNHTAPQFFYQINGASTKTNRVRTEGDPTLLSTYSNLTNSGSENGNGFECENEVLASRQAVAYAATITPDPYLGGHISIGTLTGALTVNAPTRGHAGTRITLRLLQDSTGGRVTTWNAVYKVTSTISTAASTTTHITFVYDGTNWNEVAFDGPDVTRTPADNSTNRATTAYVDAAALQRTTYAAAAGAVNRYDPNRNLYNVRNSGLMTYRAARAKAIQGSALCRISLAAGDSTYTGVTAGGGADARSTADLATNLRKLLADAGMPTGGTGIVPAPGQQTDPRWTLGSGWSSVVPYAKGITVGGTLTFTPNAGETGTIVNVWYWNNSKPFTVTIDAGSPVTVTPPGGSTLGLYQVTGLSNATHTVVITAGSQATSGTPCYCVACECGPASGITVGSLAVSGSGTAPWVSTAFPQYIYPGLHFGYESPSPFGNPLSLVFIGLLINDWNTSVALATHKSNLQTIINSWQALTVPPSIVLTVPAQADNLLGDNTASLPWGSYVQNMYQLADQNNLPLIDLDDRWQDNWTLANSLGFMTTANPFHPSAAGYQDQASALFGLIAGDI